MHEAFSPTPAPVANMQPSDLPPGVGRQVPWWRLLNSYHWFVLTVAALGWLFDCMDQQLFLLARVPAMKALAPDPAPSETATAQPPVDMNARGDFLASLATAAFICAG